MIIIGLLDRLTGTFLPRRPMTMVIALLLALYAVRAGRAVGRACDGHGQAIPDVFG